MRYTIQIPKPCHESWDEMTTTDQGRHCAQCCKTVIDFTSWQLDDILLYLQQGDGNVCGRLHRDQLNVPIYIEHFVGSVTHAPLPLYKKIAAILLFAFGLIQVSNDADAQTPKTTHYTSVSADTTRRDLQILGGMVAPRPLHDTVKPPKRTPVPPPHHLTGKPVPQKVKKTANQSGKNEEIFVSGDVWYAPAEKTK